MPDVTLTITQTPDGMVSVNGPLSNRAMCYAMLELARDVIKDHGDKAAKSPIVPAHAMPNIRLG